MSETKKGGGFIAAGSLWRPQQTEGREKPKYSLSGYLDVAAIGVLLMAAGMGERNAKILVFKNEEQEGKQPDFRLVIAYPQQQNGGSSSEGGYPPDDDTPF